MEIEDIYGGIYDLLAAIPEIKWVDQDFGQMEMERPPVAYPCVLIGIDLPGTENIGQNKQNCQVTINLRICFSYSGETSMKSPAEVRERGLAHYRTVREIYRKVQGQRIGLRPLARTGQMESVRPDRVKVLDMPFSTMFVDTSAAK